MRATNDDAIRCGGLDWTGGINAVRYTKRSTVRLVSGLPVKSEFGLFITVRIYTTVATIFGPVSYSTSLYSASLGYCTVPVSTCLYDVRLSRLGMVRRIPRVGLHTVRHLHHHTLVLVLYCTVHKKEDAVQYRTLFLAPSVSVCDARTGV